MYSLPKYQLTNNDYEDNRRLLLTKSFFIYRLTMHFREQLQIHENGFITWPEIMNWENEQAEKHNASLFNQRASKRKNSVKKSFHDHFQKIYQFNEIIYQPIIEAIAKFTELNLNFEFLKSLVLGGPPFGISGNTRVYTVTSADDPIKEPGVYIKYTPELTNQRLIDLKTEAFHAYQILSNVLVPDKAKKITGKLPKNKTMTLSSTAINVYEAVEKDYIKQYEDKVSFDSLKVVLPIVAKNLSMSEPNLRRLYYQVQNNYNLPPVTLASRI